MFKSAAIPKGENQSVGTGGDEIRKSGGHSRQAIKQGSKEAIRLASSNTVPRERKRARGTDILHST